MGGNPISLFFFAVAVSAHITELFDLLWRVGKLLSSTAVYINLDHDHFTYTGFMHMRELRAWPEFCTFTFSIPARG